jgi:hypothetical protein
VQPGFREGFARFARSLATLPTPDGDTSANGNQIAFGGSSLWLGSGDVSGGKGSVSVSAANTRD